MPLFQSSRAKLFIRKCLEWKGTSCVNQLGEHIFTGKVSHVPFVLTQRQKDTRKWPFSNHSLCWSLLCDTKFCNIVLKMLDTKNESKFAQSHLPELLVWEVEFAVLEKNFGIDCSKVYRHSTLLLLHLRVKAPTIFSFGKLTPDYTRSARRTSWTSGGLKTLGTRRSRKACYILITDIFPCFSPDARSQLVFVVRVFYHLDVLQLPWLSVVCFGSDLVTISPHKKKENHNSNQNNPGKFAKQPCTYIEI